MFILERPTDLINAPLDVLIDVPTDGPMVLINIPFILIDGYIPIGLLD